jgi:hypothetical protein
MWPRTCLGKTWFASLINRLEDWSFPYLMHDTAELAYIVGDLVFLYVGLDFFLVFLVSIYKWGLL